LDSFKEVIQKFGRLDIVINNAGSYQENYPAWKKIVFLNFTAVIRGTELAFKYMGKNCGGHGGTVVNIASASSLRPFNILPVYSGTKAAVNQLTRSYGSDLYYKKSGVKVLGLTITPLVEGGGSLIPPGEDFALAYTDEFAKCSLQTVDNMGRGLLEVLAKEENGSLWTIEGGQPPVRSFFKQASHL